MRKQPNQHQTRREFLRRMGLSSAVLPFIGNLPSLGFANSTIRKQRLVIMFSPNGVVPDAFWPDKEGDSFDLNASMTPLEPFRDRVLFLHGLNNQVRGDGDSHMRGMSCLLTGIELFPGNIQGGSHTPAGWASGASIDQEMKRYFQDRPETQTRFGSLEFGVSVPHRADPWTRMVYAGPNQPIAPIDDPYQMFQKLYGRMKDQASLVTVLDDVHDDLKKVCAVVSQEDRRLLERHEQFVDAMERELKTHSEEQANLIVPDLESGVKNVNDNIPTLSRMQIDLLISSFVNDASRVATLQYTNSVGQGRMRWLDINEGHHELSHHPDSNKESQAKLVKINRWFCEQLALLTQRLAETPEPGGEGSLLDHTTVIWTNELGKGNSHTLNNIPFVLVGNGLGFKMGRSVKYGGISHNRLLLSLAHAMNHRLDSFGKPELCGGGILPQLT